MNTLTPEKPATAHPARLLTLPLATLFLAEFSSLTSFFLLLSVMPMLAKAAGVGSSGAGLMTGSLLLGTVVAEALATIALRRQLREVRSWAEPPTYDWGLAAK